MEEMENSISRGRRTANKNYYRICTIKRNQGWIIRRLRVITHRAYLLTFLPDLRQLWNRRHMRGHLSRRKDPVTYQQVIIAMIPPVLPQRAVQPFTRVTVHTPGKGACPGVSRTVGDRIPTHIDT